MLCTAVCCFGEYDDLHKGNSILSTLLGERTGRQQQEVFLSSKAFRLNLVPFHPPIQLVRGLLPGSKAKGREAGQPSSSSAKVENKWRYTLPHMTPQLQRGIKNSDGKA